MKKILIILSLICSAYVCFGQVLEDFSDEDYTKSPTWTPDDANNWTVVNGQLRSNSVIANSSFFITTLSSKAAHAQWDFFLQLQFNTSGANFADIYLISDESNLFSPTNSGYFVRIGGTNDEISLYKMTSGLATILINGTDGVTNRANNPLHIKVIRDENDNWSLQHDVNGGNTFVLEGVVFDNSITTCNFFGIRIQQSTSSFFSKHFFDNIYVGDIVIENDPPFLNSLQVLSNSQLLLLFNEPIRVASAQTRTNYRASNNIGNPSIAELQPDEKSILLTFTEHFGNGIANVLEISGVQDIAGNTIIPINQPFLFFNAMPLKNKDVIITEIFADPSPQIGLPEAEFIEIYNRSPNPIDLTGWKFSDGNSVATIPSKIILPNQYWIICSSTSAALFAQSAATIGVSNFPTLNNNGDALTLKTNKGLLMDSLNYTLSWYQDEDKKEGGWSLELIDPNNPCGEEDNWTASEDNQGGTPGKVNSVNANKPDLTGPKLVSVSVTKPNELLLLFNEKLESSVSILNFSITPQLDMVTTAFNSPSLREIKLVLFQNLDLRQVYSLAVNNLRDCNGNLIQDDHNQQSFALPEIAEIGDVLVNEILFNPRPGGVDFVEIVNVSSKYINLKHWSLANREDEVYTNLKPITQNDFLLAPLSFLVFTANPAILKSQYSNAQEPNLFNTIIPSMNDDLGSIAILSDNGRPIDSFLYSEKFHSPLLKDKEGVSLERISSSQLTNNADNWKSANSSIGYATPGYINSNSRPENVIDENAVQVEPEIFSPNVPGQDFAKINYRFDQSALAANIKIVDHQGRLIKEVANNETLGYEGFFRWDGDRDDGNKARMGYYFVWFETFDLSGTVKTYRKRVIVGR